MSEEYEIEACAQESHRREILHNGLTAYEREAVEEREALWKALGYPHRLYEIAAALTSAERRGFRRATEAAVRVCESCLADCSCSVSIRAMKPESA